MSRLECVVSQFQREGVLPLFEMQDYRREGENAVLTYKTPKRANGFSIVYKEKAEVQDQDLSDDSARFQQIDTEKLRSSIVVLCLDPFIPIIPEHILLAMGISQSGKIEHTFSNYDLHVQIAHFGNLKGDFEPVLQKMVDTYFGRSKFDYFQSNPIHLGEAHAEQAEWLR